MKVLRSVILWLCLSVTANTALAASLWVAGEGKLRQVDARTGAVLKTLDIASGARLAATPDERVWVLANDRVQLVGSSPGNALDLGALGYSSTSILAVSPYDASVWVATSQGSIVHVSADAAVLATYALPAAPRVAAVALNGNLWVAGEQQLWNLDSNGRIAATLALGPSLSAPTAISIDALGDSLWLANDRGIVKVAVADLSRLQLGTQISLGVVRGIALDARAGVLWVLGGTTLSALNRDARSAAQIELPSVGAANATSITFDAAEETVVLGGGFGLIGLSDTGGPLFTTTLAAPITALVGTPFKLAPTLLIAQPVTASVTSDPRPEIVMPLGALCNGINCGFPNKYLQDYRITATLNGQDISSALVFDLNQGQVSYRPKTDLPGGKNTLTAYAADRFGNRSAVASDYWSIQSTTTSSTLAATSSTSTETLSASGTITTKAAPSKNKAPTASLSAPQSGATFSQGATITITATATDTDGTVARVDFLDGTTVIGTDNTAPYSFSWTTASIGSHSLTAKATDNAGAAGTSAAVSISVVGNLAPTVSLTSPANGSAVAANEPLTIAATAADSDGTITKVEFFAGAVLLGTATSSPYQAVWPSVPAGTHSLTARATDDKGATTTSSAVVVTAVAPPLVVITAPASCGRVDAPASTLLAADAESGASNIVKVEFFNGTTLLGTDTDRPFTLSLSNLPAAEYSFIAKATNAAGLSAVSRAVTLSVGAPNSLPTVALTSPANNAVFGPAPSIALAANAADTDGTINSVKFYANGTQLIGTATAAPYTATWTNVSADTYLLTAIATDDRGGTTTSAAVSVSVSQNAQPVVSLTEPSAGASFYAPARVQISANASDSDGTISQVEFFLNGQFLGRSTSAPYGVIANAVTAGTHSITARATDNLGAVTTSNPVSITVLPNGAPTVDLTEPVNNTVLYAGATVRVAANAADSDGTIARVEFYANSTLIGTDTSAPYTSIWDNVPGGNFLLTAVAFDDRGGATTSVARSVTVNSGPTLAFIEPTIDPTYGVASGVGSVYVRGTVNAPPNSTVTVNSQVGIIDDAGQFHVNNVPLSSGETTILTAIVTTQDGQSFSHDLVVVNGGEPAFTVAPNANWGVGQKLVTFSVQYPGTVPLQRFEFDLDSNGTIDYVATPADFASGVLSLQLTYPQPGRYIGRVTGFDASGQPVLTVKHAVIMKDPALLGGMLEGVYNRMVDRLKLGNADRALTAITGSSRDKYRTLFTTLLAQTPGFAEALGAIGGGEITEEYGELVAVRSSAEGSEGFLIYLICGGDGIWRIDSM